MANEPTIEFSGNVGKDPETRTFQNGNSVTTVNVAVTPSYQKNGQWTDKETIWFQVTPMSNAAKAQIPFITKGSRVVVSGQLTTYTNDKGTKYLQVAARTLAVLHTSKDSQKSAPAQSSAEPWASYSEPALHEPPF